MTMTPRIFGIGFNKTGTSTLGKCFDILGLGPTARPQVLHDTFMPGTGAAQAVGHLLVAGRHMPPSDADFGEFPYRAICDQVFDHRNYAFALSVAELFRSFHDRPWNIGPLYRILDQHFPGSRFILTWRSPEAWWRSTRRWLTVMHHDDPARLQRYLKHCNADRLDQEQFITAYVAHNDTIRHYFSQRADFLEINFEEETDWAPLCAFLDRPIPVLPFPHENRQDYEAGKS